MTNHNVYKLYLGILKTNHSVLRLYLRILKANHSFLWLYLGILKTNQSEQIKIKSLGYFGLCSSALASKTQQQK